MRISSVVPFSQDQYRSIASRIANMCNLFGSLSYCHTTSQLGFMWKINVDPDSRRLFSTSRHRQESQEVVHFACPISEAFYDGHSWVPFTPVCTEPYCIMLPFVGYNIYLYAMQCPSVHTCPIASAINTQLPIKTPLCRCPHRHTQNSSTRAFNAPKTPPSYSTVSLPRFC